MVLWLKTQTGAGFQPQLHMGELLKLFASELLSVKGDDVNDSTYHMYLIPLLILTKFLLLSFISSCEVGD